MTWEQKLHALSALCDFKSDVYLFMRSPGEWGVHVPFERKEGSCLSGGGLSGATPEAAVESAWLWASDQKHYIVVDAYKPTRRAVRWNGFMWLSVDEKGRS